MTKFPFGKELDDQVLKNGRKSSRKKPGVKRKLTMIEEFVLVMMKFRLGLDNITLSVLFGVSAGHISSLFSTFSGPTI